MWVLSGLADQISPDFDAQCRLLSKLGLRYLEFRSAWNVDALDLVAEQLCMAKTILASHGLGVSSIGSPIGKILINEDFEPHLEQMRHAADVARFFDAPYIRISSFVIPKGADAGGYRDEVLRRMRDLTRVAEESRVILLHENEKNSYGDIPAGASTSWSPWARPISDWPGTPLTALRRACRHHGQRCSRASPSGIHTDQGRPLGTDPVAPLARRDGEPETPAPSHRTASRASSPSNHTSTRGRPLGSSSRADLPPRYGPAFTDILSTEDIPRPLTFHGIRLILPCMAGD